MIWTKSPTILTGNVLSKEKLSGNDTWLNETDVSMHVFRHDISFSGFNLFVCRYVKWWLTYPVCTLNFLFAYNRTPTTSTGIGSSIIDEIWTSANDRKFYRTPTTSTGIGSSVNLRDENNRSLESRDGKYYPTTPTTSGLGSSSERQSIETQRSGDLPDHLWAAAMEDGFSRFNAMKSLQTITRQPRPNHDWVKTERISRFTKHRTISQSPEKEQEIWTSRLNEINVSGYATSRTPQHRCHHQTRRSFSTSIVAELAGTPITGSQQSLGSAEFLVSPI